MEVSTVFISAVETFKGYKEHHHMLRCTVLTDGDDWYCTGTGMCIERFKVFGFVFDTIKPGIGSLSLSLVERAVHEPTRKRSIAHVLCVKVTRSNHTACEP